MNWKTINGKLEKEFTFKNFNEALKFVNQVGIFAEESNHHPDILLHSYKKVNISLLTHSEEKITEKDHNLAKKIDSL
ncbi:4a-hydroxytetrahydrobiopterin dehydratase [Sunxiuqinia sp. A32]|uniref:4a-hydroxytetrahydrobiopterin dehydratase n=1 Tax=Sunxiuqinia sp. A32 TaxID=3461496 RepID=UPI004045A178